MSSSLRQPMEGQAPLFELDDPKLFPLNETPELQAYYAELDRQVDTRGISYNQALRQIGRPPGFPQGAKLCSAVLRGEVDYRDL